MGVLAQRLSRKVDPEHREPYQVTARDLRRFGFEHPDPEELITLYRGIPHEDNRMTGYRGRMGIHELLTMNAEIAELVVQRAPLNNIKMAAKANGMKELRKNKQNKKQTDQTKPKEDKQDNNTAGY